MARMVNCVKLGRELPGLDAPPFPGPLGERIYNEISRQAWGMWPAQATRMINHYGLNMADPQAHKMLMQAMEDFFFGANAAVPEGWSPPVQSGKGGAPRRK